MQKSLTNTLYSIDTREDSFLRYVQDGFRAMPSGIDAVIDRKVESLRIETKDSGTITIKKKYDKHTAAFDRDVTVTIDENDREPSISSIGTVNYNKPQLLTSITHKKPPCKEVVFSEHNISVEYGKAETTAETVRHETLHVIDTNTRTNKCGLHSETPAFKKAKKVDLKALKLEIAQAKEGKHLEKRASDLLTHKDPNETFAYLGEGLGDIGAAEEDGLIADKAPQTSDAIRIAIQKEIFASKNCT